MAKRATDNGTTAASPAPAHTPAVADTAAQQIPADDLNFLPSHELSEVLVASNREHLFIGGSVEFRKSEG